MGKHSKPSEIQDVHQAFMRFDYAYMHPRYAYPDFALTTKHLINDRDTSDMVPIADLIHKARRDEP